MCLFTLSGIQSASDQLQFESDSVLGHGSEDPFSNGCVRDGISGYFGANQWCRTYVSWQPLLVIISEESQSAIQVFHYMLLLFPVQLFMESIKFLVSTILVRDRDRVNIAR